jgi:hypothetical protein
MDLNLGFHIDFMLCEPMMGWRQVEVTQRERQSTMLIMI